MVRVSDIARRAGVSTATVSRVLNKSGLVHPETERRVTQAMEELGYRPNMLARSLRRRQTHTIGLVVSDIENPFFTEVTRAVETTAYGRGYSVIVCNTDESLEKEMLYVDVLFGKQVDGIILAPAPGDHAFLTAYLNRNARVVFVNRCLSEIPYPSVVGDDEEAMFALTERLLAMGHERIGVVLGLRDVWTTQRRFDGFCRALESRRLSLDDAWLFDGKARREGGLEAARLLADTSNPPTALVAFNRLMLDGVLLGLAEHAPHLLRRVEVTGFGYSPVARACRSSEYYIAQPTYEIGHVAVTLLVDALEGKAAWTTDCVILRNQLVEVPPG